MILLHMHTQLLNKVTYTCKINKVKVHMSRFFICKDLSSYSSLSVVLTLVKVLKMLLSWYIMHDIIYYIIYIIHDTHTLISMYRISMYITIHWYILYIIYKYMIHIQYFNTFLMNWLFELYLLMWLWSVLHNLFTL